MNLVGGTYACDYSKIYDKKGANGNILIQQDNTILSTNPGNFYSYQNEI
jgi:hypothetical protein